MERKKALEELLAKVEAGEHLPSGLIFDALYGSVHINAVRQSHNGSLDAAKALHEAVLSGWQYNLAPSYCNVFPSHNNGDQKASLGVSDPLARAWLIAILKALISQENE